MARKQSIREAEETPTLDTDSFEDTDLYMDAEGKGARLGTLEAPDTSKENKKTIAGAAGVEAADADLDGVKEDVFSDLFDGEGLSETFKSKIKGVFEAEVARKTSVVAEALAAEMQEELETKVQSTVDGLSEKVDEYLNYVVENWMKENEVAVETGLRSEIAEDFMSALQVVFKEHYIEVPEGKVDLVDELSSQVAELEESLNKTTEENIRLYESTQSLERAEIVRRHSSGLAETEAEKLSSLVEDIEFDNAESFEMKVSVVKESYFKQDVTESVDEVNAAIGNQEADEVQSISNSMAAYTQAITKSIK